MVDKRDDSLRPCGLYRTTVDLAEHPDSVGPGQLVFFHNHSDQGTPIVLLPESNRHNRWKFQQPGLAITDAVYVDSLVPLASEGFYRVREHFHPNDNEVVAANALVQLGYTRTADPIIFFPSRPDTGNTLVFPANGMKVSDAVHELLDRLDTRGPRPPRRLH